MNRIDIDMALMKIKLLGCEVQEITFLYIHDNNRITAFVNCVSVPYPDRNGDISINYDKVFNTKASMFNSKAYVRTVEEAVDFVEKLNLFDISTFRIVYTGRGVTKSIRL